MDQKFQPKSLGHQNPMCFYMDTVLINESEEKCSRLQGIICIGKGLQIAGTEGLRHQPCSNMEDLNAHPRDLT